MLKSYEKLRKSKSYEEWMKNTDFKTREKQTLNSYLVIHNFSSFVRQKKKQENSSL